MAFRTTVVELESDQPAYFVDRVCGLEGQNRAQAKRDDAILRVVIVPVILQGGDHFDVRHLWLSHLAYDSSEFISPGARTFVVHPVAEKLVQKAFGLQVV